MAVFYNFSVSDCNFSVSDYNFSVSNYNFSVSDFCSLLSCVHFILQLIFCTNPLPERKPALNLPAYKANSVPVRLFTVKNICI